MPALTTTKQKRILTTLDAAIRDIDADIPTLNNGGCGLFAEHLYNILKTQGFNPKLAILSRADESKIQYGIDNNLSGIHVPFSHIVVVVGRKVIDSTGVHSSTKGLAFWYHKMSYVKGLPVSLLKQWNRENIWNDTFNRRTELPKLRRRLKKVEATLSEI